jgi:putative hydrolase
MERIRLEDLVRSVTPIVVDTTGLDLPELRVNVLTRAGWAAEALDDFRDLFDRLARATGVGSNETPKSADAGADPLAGIMRMVGPMMTSSAIGALVGRVAGRALGTYDVLLPRRTDRLTFVPAAVLSFATEWSIPIDRALTHVVVADLASHAVLRIEHVAARLRDLLGRHADAACLDTDGLTQRIEGMVTGSADFDPELLRASEPTGAQLALRGEIDDLLTPVVGFVDYATMVVGARLLGDNRQVVEAWRRHRSSDSELERQVVDLMGVRSASSLAERGASFIGGVIERAGRDGLAALWSRPEHLPTRSELDAPGLWLARIELI